MIPPPFVRLPRRGLGYYFSCGRRRLGWCSGAVTKRDSPSPKGAGLGRGCTATHPHPHGDETLPANPPARREPRVRSPEGSCDQPPLATERDSLLRAADVLQHFQPFVFRHRVHLFRRGLNAQLSRAIETVAAVRRGVTVVVVVLTPVKVAQGGLSRVRVAFGDGLLLLRLR